MSNFKFHTIETAPEGSKAILEGATETDGDDPRPLLSDG